MSPVQNTKVLFNAIPEGEATLDTFKVVTDEKIDVDADLQNDEILLKLLTVSLDPYMRGRMRGNTKSYVPPFKVGSPIEGFAIAEVLKSKSSRFPQGAHVYGTMPYSTYIKRAAPTQEQDDFYRKHTGGPELRILENKEGLPWSAYIGAAGMPGKTAYMAWKHFAGCNDGDNSGKVAYVSAGSGPVGQMVIQVAKKNGLKVITSAGSDEKIQFCKDIGADVVFNYKTDNASEIFAKEAPDGINVNWVNVGGQGFEAELEHMAQNGRIIVCGWISSYNGKSDGIRNLFQIVSKRLQINGFIVSDIEPQYAEEFYATVPKALANKEIKFAEVKYDGIEKVPQAFLDLLAGNQGGGKGLGKVVVDVQ